MTGLPDYDHPSLALQKAMQEVGWSYGPGHTPQTRRVFAGGACIGEFTAVDVWNALARYHASQHPVHFQSIGRPKHHYSF